jgi:hypothetical protein
MMSTGYYPGGYLPDASHGNKSWEMDSGAGTYTTWDKNGEQTSQRPLTPAEVAAFAAEDAAATADANGTAIRVKVSSALTVNAAFLALSSPTNAQTLARVKTLTRECSALIRLLLGALTDASDT